MSDVDNDYIYVFSDRGYKTYFKSEAQAENYKKYREKIKTNSKDVYYIEKIKFEDEGIDYIKIKLFSTVKFEFNNYLFSSLNLTENKKERQVQYFPDTEENKLYKKPSVKVTVIDYEKPTISVKYSVCVEDTNAKNKIEELIEKFNVLNKKILKEATTLCKAEMSENITAEEENGFFVSCTLTDNFEKEMEMFING